MKPIIMKTLLVSIPLILMIDGCCKPEVIIKKEYVECKYPDIEDLNYTNDTNYTLPIIDYEIVIKDVNES